MPSKEKSAFSHFFREDAEVIHDIIYGDSSPEVAKKVGTAKKEVYPTIALPGKIKEDELKAKWQELRSFFRNANSRQALTGDLSPVLMAPIYTKNLVGSDFPIWVADEKHEGDSDFCSSLKKIIRDRLHQIGPEEEDAHILKENLERMIHIANEKLADKKPHLSRLVIEEVLTELEEQLDVSGDELQPFNANLKALRQSLPESGILLPYTSNTSLQLLEAAMVATRGMARLSLKNDVKQLISRLKDILRVEREKSPERKDPGQLHESMEFADRMMDFEELSSLLPDSGSEIISDERKNRITNIIEVLEQSTEITDQKCFVFVDDLLYKSKKIDWANLLGTTDVAVYEKGSGVSMVKSAFDQHITEWTSLFKAKRMGELEFKNSYQPEIHDDFFEHFKWHSYSKEELNTCPYFILIADDVRLFETEFSQLSAMLSANTPVKIVAVKRNEDVDQSRYGSENKMAGWHANTELGALMLSYKNIYITQSTAITPGYLFERFREGLSAFAPAFFYLLNIDRSVHKDSYLWTSASVESRDFPGFTYRGLLGTSWGSRFEVSNNPQPEKAWPIHELTVLDHDRKKTKMELPFTFTDWAVLNPAYSHHFMYVNASYWSDDLIPLTEFIDNSDETNIGKVPFIWMMDGANQLQKVAVSWPMVLATQERLDFWHFLQENSGIDNYHVNNAVQSAKEAMMVEREQVIAELKSKHEAEIQKVREEEAGMAMENLTNMLLDLDAGQLAGKTIPVPSASVDRSAPAEEPDPEPAAQAVEKEDEQEDDISLSNDPYIETALCTTCNECTELNSAMFKYDADKLAYIADPKAGTYADLVEAAEKCPVSIIHPGAPLDQDEPGLEDLVRRAEKYN